MSTTTGTLPGVRTIDLPVLGAVTDGTSLVGERSGTGRFNAASVADYVAGHMATNSAGQPFVGPITIHCNPGYYHYVTANPWHLLYSSFDCVGTTASMTDPEFLGTFGLTVTTGNGVAGNLGDKVALYAGTNCLPGAGDSWAVNTVITQTAGSGSYNCQGYELDYNNLNAHRGDGVAGAGFAAPVAYGLAITGASTFRSTAALLISGSATQWNRGIAFTGCVVQATLQDFSSSTVSYEMFGSHSYGIDMYRASFTQAAIRIGNSAAIVARNADDTADLRLVRADNANNLLLGDPNVAGVFVPKTLSPTLDNVASLGLNGARWTAVWAVNGTIQTSDPALKTDITPLPSTLGLVEAINPVTFRWKDGGGGSPGQRTHWGFLAPDVKAAMDGIGMDFGGYVRGDDGTHHLRPDQMVPVLWQAVRELSEEIKALKAAHV